MSELMERYEKEKLQDKLKDKKEAINDSILSALLFIFMFLFITILYFFLPERILSNGLEFIMVISFLILFGLSISYIMEETKKITFVIFLVSFNIINFFFIYVKEIPLKTYEKLEKEFIKNEMSDNKITGYEAYFILDRMNKEHEIKMKKIKFDQNKKIENDRKNKLENEKNRLK